jgi:hypothetical protein
MKWCGHVRTLWVKYQPSQPYNIYLFILELKRFIASLIYLILSSTSTCFIQKIYAPSSSLLQGKHLPFSPSPLRLNNFRLFVILSQTQLYRYTPELFLFSTATFKYIYRPPSDKLDKNSQRKWLIQNVSQWNGCIHFRSG